MKKIVLTIAALLSLTSIAYAQKRIQIFQKSDKFGINVDGKVQLKADYEDIKYLDAEYFAARKKLQYGVINLQGKMVIPFSYDAIKLYGQGLFLVKKNTTWGLVDTFNRELLPIEYVSFRFITDEVCEVKTNGKLGLINKYGDVLIKPLYDKIEPFAQDTYLVYEGSKCGIVDSKGNIIVAVRYDGFEKKTNGNQYIVRLGHRIGIMDALGKIILEPLYDSIEESPLGMKLMQDGLIGFYTQYGKLIQPRYSQILFMQPELQLLVVKHGDKFGLVTSSGVETGTIYENISRFSNKGIAFVEKNGKLMAINAQGKELLVQDIMQGYNRPPGQK